MAYDLTVIMEVENTHERLEGIPVYATTPEGKFIAGSTYNAADSVYIIRDLPDRPLHVRYEIGDKQYARSINEPIDSTTITISADMLAHNLREVAVEADRQFFTDEKLVVIPDKQVKKISNDATSLLRNMAIGNVWVSPTGSISTPAGDGYAIFVDYLPASGSDMSNMMTANVSRVEVYEYPRDPRFGGARYVINFITQQYEYGGYTRVNGMQDFAPAESGNYNVFSRFAYKRMTYDVTAGYNYSRTRHNLSESEMNYTLSDGVITVKRDIIESMSKNHGVSAYGKALYMDDRNVIQNDISVSSSKAPDNYTVLDERFSSPVYISGTNRSMTDADNLSVGWNGYYRFVMPRDMMLTITPNFSYGSFKNLYSYRAGESDITNDARDRAWDTSLKASLSKFVGNHVFTADLSGNLSGNNIDYAGTTQSAVDAKHYNAAVRLAANLRFGRFTIMPTFTFIYTNHHYNGHSITEWRPKYFISANYSINQRNTLSIASEMSYWTISVQQRSPMFQISDQITAIQGNPRLKSYPFNSAILNYNYIPLNNLSLSAYVNYNRRTNQIVDVYDLMEINGREYLVSTPRNIGFRNTLSYGVSASARLFNNRLNLSARADLNSYGQHGPYHFNGTRASYGVNATYIIKSFYVSAAYQSENRQIDQTAYTITPHFYYLHAGWSNSNFYLAATVYNPFTSSYKSGKTEYHLANYNGYKQIYSPRNHRYFELSATYTFSYGKKVNHDSENTGGTSVRSGIMK